MVFCFFLTVTRMWSHTFGVWGGEEIFGKQVFKNGKIGG